MPEVSASAVASLRARTGVSILKCKKALEEAGGDEEKAIDILRKSGLSEVAKKSERDQSEGKVFIADGDAKAAMVMLRCETDFVARDDAFNALGQELATALLQDGSTDKAEGGIPAAVQKLGENISLGEVHIVEAPVVGSYVHSNAKIGVIIGLDGGDVAKAKDVAMHAAAMNPEYVLPDDVPAEAVEKEKSIWKEQLASEGKPAEIMEKIMLGKEKKFREENALLKQDFVKEPGTTVEEYLAGAKVQDYVRLAVS